MNPTLLKVKQYLEKEGWYFYETSSFRETKGIDFHATKRLANKTGHSWEFDVSQRELENGSFSVEINFPSIGSRNVDIVSEFIGFLNYTYAMAKQVEKIIKEDYYGAKS